MFIGMFAGCVGATGETCEGCGNTIRATQRVHRDANGCWWHTGCWAQEQQSRRRGKQGQTRNRS